GRAGSDRAGRAGQPGGGRRRARVRARPQPHPPEAGPVSAPAPGGDRAQRLLAAAGRIRASAVVLPDDALTDPDPDSGERWDRGQVLAHVAEMLPYWAQQAELIAAGGQAEFGRVKSDPGRVAAIERERREDPQ